MSPLSTGRHPPGRPAARAPTPAARIGRPLFRAFFDADGDTSAAQALRDAAAEAGLDLAPFEVALGDPALREEELAADVAAVDEVRVEVVPTALAASRRLEGAAPEAAYWAAAEAQLAEEPRGAGV